MASIIKTAEELIEEFKDITWLTENQIRNYAAYVAKHIVAVQAAGIQLGVPDAQLKIHDWSKYGPDEFPAYARKFFPGDNPVNPEKIEQDFAYAWLGHLHRNPHHHDHFVFPDGYTPTGSNVEEGALEMPQVFALEMLADWMGAGYAITGGWDMSEWLKKNIPKIRLHSNTAAFMRDCLNRLGYFKLMADVKFIGEK